MEWIRYNTIIKFMRNSQTLFALAKLNYIHESYSFVIYLLSAVTTIANFLKVERILVSAIHLAYFHGSMTFLSNILSI